MADLAVLLELLQRLDRLVVRRDVTGPVDQQQVDPVGAEAPQAALGGGEALAEQILGDTRPVRLGRVEQGGAVSRSPSCAARCASTASISPESPPKSRKPEFAKRPQGRSGVRNYRDDARGAQPAPSAHDDHAAEQR